MIDTGHYGDWELNVCAMVSLPKSTSSSYSNVKCAYQNFCQKKDKKKELKHFINLCCKENTNRGSSESILSLSSPWLCIYIKFLHIQVTLMNLESENNLIHLYMIPWFVELDKSILSVIKKVQSFMTHLIPGCIGHRLNIVHVSVLIGAI